MITDGHREENITHQGLLGGRISLGEIPKLDDGVMDAANHHGMFIPM